MEAAKRLSSVEETRQPTFIRGKYEELQTGDLYKGISEAFGHWYASLPLETKRTLGKSLRDELEEAVGDDIDVLADFAGTRNRIAGFRCCPALDSGECRGQSGLQRQLIY